MPGVTKILLIDDHTLFRAGLRLLLKSFDQKVSIFEADHLDQGLAILRQVPDLDLCLLDLNLGDENGVSLFAKIKAESMDTTVVVVSGDEKISTIKACIEAGAMSYIPKSASPDLLSDAIKSVLAGAVFLPDSVMAHGDANQPQALTLTPRLTDVLRGLCQAKSTKAIARDLHLSEHTVKDYINTLFKMLDVHNRTEVVIKAGQLKLLN